ncbi:MAG: hypothetical protein COC01_07575 [Bacteroidetes bacterium]|nr:MAG: hypothetical protein COC01_07575 [Bacteroidota bacterium]
MNNPVNDSDTLVRTNPAYYTVIKPNVLTSAFIDKSLSKYEMRLLILLLQHRKEAKNNNYELAVPVKELADTSQIGWQKNIYLHADQVAESLMRRVVKIKPEEHMALFGTRENRNIHIVSGSHYIDGKGFIHIEYDKYFVQIFDKMLKGFTKGEFELLIKLNSFYAYCIYWLVRENQWHGSERIITLDQLKDTLGIAPEQYKNRNDNFKVKVLNVAQRELKGSWAEFDYQIKRVGKGQFNVHFYFKSDILQEIEENITLTKPWEKELKGIGVFAKSIKEIRAKIFNREKIGNTQHEYDGFYLNQCVKIGNRLYHERVRNKSKEQIKDLASYVLRAIQMGWWIDEVERERTKEKDRTQTKLFDQPKSYPVETVKELARAKGVSLDELCKQMGYTLNGDTVMIDQSTQIN